MSAALSLVLPLSHSHSSSHTNNTHNYSLDEVGDKVAVAIAPDSWSPISALTPEQYTVAAISEVWSEHGFLRIDGQARAGHRIRFVVRVVYSSVCGLKRERGEVDLCV